MTLIWFVSTIIRFYFFFHMNVLLFQLTSTISQLPHIIHYYMQTENISMFIRCVNNSLYILKWLWMAYKRWWWSLCDHNKTNFNPNSTFMYLIWTSCAFHCMYIVHFTYFGYMQIICSVKTTFNQSRLFNWPNIAHTAVNITSWIVYSFSLSKSHSSAKSFTFYGHTLNKVDNR